MSEKIGYNKKYRWKNASMLVKI